MKKIYTLLTACLLLIQAGYSQSDIIITGVVDGDLSGGLPKAIELYVVNDVADASVYGVGAANNGGGTDGVEFILPADAFTAGDFIYLTTDLVAFEDFFGFQANYDAGSAAAINGDDAVELFLNENLVDVFGDPDVNGDGEPWDYTDSWAYRQNATGPTVPFNVGEWIAPGLGTLEDETSNETAVNPFPAGTYTTEGGGSAGEVTIQEIQETTDPSGDSPLVNQEVTTTGVVTAVFDEGFWIQDGTGEWSGIHVAVENPAVVLGDEVTVTGTVQESFGLTAIGNTTAINVDSQGNTLPTAEALNTGSAGAESYESVLIQISGATCTDDNLGFGEWEIDDSSGPYRVDDLLYDADPQLLVGYDVTGIAYFSFSNFKMLPRDMDDVTINDAASETGLEFEATEIGVDETSGIITINVDIVNPAETEVTVEVVTNGGTAQSGVHYNFTEPTTLTFPASSTDPQSFEVEIIDDAVENEDRTVIFNLQNVSTNATIIGGELTLTIDDDDTEITITDISEVSEENADGEAVNDGEEFTVAGLVYGVNMNSGGLSFTVIDQTGGIGVFNFDVIDGYEVNQGDSVVITGTVGQFNGLTQLSPSSIDLISQDNEIDEPTVVTELGADTESEFVKIECVYLVDPSEWTNSGPGFNVTVTDDENEYEVRIDNDVDLYGQPAPTDTFNVIGIGGQFDSSFPFTEGYQLFPRSSADIESADCAAVTAPENDECVDAIDIASLTGGDLDAPQTSGAFTNVDATSENDPNPNDVEDNCWFGEPLQSNTVWFSFEGDGNEYFIETVECGEVTDYIDDGDTQMAIFTGDCGDLTQVACNEDGPQSSGDEFPAGITLVTEPGVTYSVMIDGYEGADGEFCMQMTATSLLSAENVDAFEFAAFPNPTNGMVTIESPEALQNVALVNVLGQRVKEWNFTSAERFEFDASGMEPGMYLLQATSGDKVSTLKLIVE